MPLSRGRTVAYRAWRALTLALLVLVVGWDAAGLLILGDKGYSSPSYEVLRHLMPFGMRSYGPPLAALFVASLIAYGRHHGGAGRSYLMLRVCLSLTAAWYALWGVGIAASYIVTGAIVWGAAKLLFIAFTALVLARLTPTSRREHEQG